MFSCHVSTAEIHADLRSGFYLLCGGVQRVSGHELVQFNGANLHPVFSEESMCNFTHQKCIKKIHKYNGNLYADTVRMPVQSAFRTEIHSVDIP